MSQLTVYDLKSRETWQELLDEVHSALGMPTALLDADNVILQSSGERNELCREIRSLEKAKPVICGQSQKFMAEMARTKITSIMEICEAGMAKIVVPVFRDQKFLGSITCCGSILPEMEIEAYFIEKTTGLGGDVIADMAEKIPIVQKEKLQLFADNLFRRL